MRETLDYGSKRKVKYRGGSLHITVSDNQGDGCPYSITVHCSNEDINKDPDLLSHIDGAERFINVSLRNIGWEETCRKCIATKRRWSDFYGLVFQEIARYLGAD